MGAVGYAPRVGLVYIDYLAQRPIPKVSFDGVSRADHECAHEGEECLIAAVTGFCWRI